VEKTGALRCLQQCVSKQTRVQSQATFAAVAPFVMSSRGESNFGLAGRSAVIPCS